MSFQKYRSKPLKWWLQTPLYASRLVRAGVRGSYRGLVHQNEFLWNVVGRPSPAPPPVKRDIVRGYVVKYGLTTFVETGTWHGDTTAILADVCERVYSIELSPELVTAARGRFEAQPHVKIIEGDSSKELPSLIDELDGPCLFWLDGHFSGGDTVRGSSDTPIEIELEAVLRAMKNDPEGLGKSVILIDDARDFGKGDYPPLSVLKQKVLEFFPQAQFKVETDIMRIIIFGHPFNSLR